MSRTSLAGRRAWVVGASSGIGAATAQELVYRGADVAVTARREDALQAVSGGRMLAVAADVTDADAIAAAAEKVEADLGPIDIAVLSAGYWQQFDPRAWSVDAFERHVAVNLLGMSSCIAAVLPSMLARDEGTIAGVASVAGFRGLPGAEAYGATKAAQISMLESLRIDLADTGVRITTICPGFVDTDMTAANDFPMPFMISAEAAGRAICDGLERRRTEIVFPPAMAALMRGARHVPTSGWPLLWRVARNGRAGARRDQEPAA
ncbi:MAG TPA: SDR family NAD(P)-dependent oxidoreductase [Mycobacteriales bacterium]|nr:SDR family NAD(P)-dependent oxidoreductase [Mycobacteriales bacterium]